VPQINSKTGQATLAPYVTSDGFIDGSSTEAARSTFNSGVKAFLDVVPYDRHKVNVARRDSEDGGDTTVEDSIYLNLLY